jgi:hypothetical protein
MSDICNEYFDGNETKMISAFNDFRSDHLQNRNEASNMDDHGQIEDQRFADERNQRLFKK